MSPRTVALAITLATAVTVAGVTLWLSRPSPGLPPPLPEAAVPFAFQPRPVHQVTLSNGDKLWDVPTNCEPDDAGSLSCQDLCTADTDCPMDHPCAADPEYGHRACQPPALFCNVDPDCPEDQACLPVSPSASGVVLRRCFPHGKRKAGERCDGYFSGGNRFCEAGLTCIRGLCGPRCDVRHPSCPDGWECLPDDKRVLGGCLPSCRARPCPQGQHCRPFGVGARVCLKAVGYDCANLPCPEGHGCLVGFADPERETAAAECRATCDGKRCPRGQECDERSGFCYHRCTRDEQCTAPERCAPPYEGAPHKGCTLLDVGLPGSGRGP
jgi:hypothetical protein